MEKLRYGLIGKKLGHSWSPRIHGELADYDYRLYELSEEQLPLFLKNGDLGGLNVTIPYKKTVMSYCDELTEAAADIGSVNTLRFTEKGIIGHNTDCDGFRYMLKRAGIDPRGKKVLVLGSGGTSKTACYCLKLMGAGNVIVISRTGEDNYLNLYRHYDAEIIVNTTPVGMFPDNKRSAIDLSPFGMLEGVADVVYNPMRTALMLQARRMGVKATCGLPMLVKQAVSAAGFFTDSAFPEEETERILTKITGDIENIVLIGMPGSGKTSVAAKIAALSGRKFIDTDAMIEKTAGKSIPDIFAEDGEAVFRHMESEALAEAGKENGIVIATGGGSVLKSENVDALKQNGRLYLITCPISRLAVSGRPLSVDLEAMYDFRMPKYIEAADETVSNETTIETTAKTILEAHYETARS